MPDRTEFIGSIIDNYPAFINNYVQLMTIYDFCNLYGIPMVNTVNINDTGIEFSADYRRRDKEIPTNFTSGREVSYAIETSINNKIINVKMSMA